MGKIDNPLPRPMACSSCTSPDIRLTENHVLYGRNYGDWPLIWFCNKCKAAVGCHPKTDIPLGLMADRPTRQLRKKAHEAFDPIWQKAAWLTRRQAYAWLAGELGLPVSKCHISMFNREVCRRVIHICENTKPAKKDFQHKPRTRKKGNHNDSSR